MDHSGSLYSQSELLKLGDFLIAQRNGGVTTDLREE